MKRMMTAVAASLALATTMSVAAQQNPPQQQDQKKPDVILTGCLTQGSTPTTFVFTEAKKNDVAQQQANAPQKKYTIVAVTEDLNLREHLNHEVRITGQVDDKAMTPTRQMGQTGRENAQVAEKDLPKLSAKSLTMVSDTCTAAAR